MNLVVMRLKVLRSLTAIISHVRVPPSLARHRLLEKSDGIVMWREKKDSPSPTLTTVKVSHPIWKL